MEHTLGSFEPEPHTFAPINYTANPTPPASVMDECNPATDFINPQDISHDSQYPQDMSSRSTSVSDPSGHPAPIDDGSCDANKKKRKSWGQVLPKPTTNLPPRKRAKTDEEKAQRKYERVQRNRHAAHMSRMRKQDEMENLRIENDRLRIDNTELENEIHRLRDQLAGQPVAPTNHQFSPNIKPEYEARPITPPQQYERSLSIDSISTSPQSVPSLAHSISSHTSVDSEHQPDTHQPLFTQALAAFDPSTVNPADLKQSDVSRSAETCSLQWTSESPKVVVVSSTPRRSQRIKIDVPQADETDRFCMDDLIDFDNVEADAGHDDDIEAACPSPSDTQHSDALGEYQAADGENELALDEATDAAILDLPRMMNNAG